MIATMMSLKMLKYSWHINALFCWVLRRINTVKIIDCDFLGLLVEKDLRCPYIQAQVSIWVVLPTFVS